MERTVNIDINQAIKEQEKAAARKLNSMLGSSNQRTYKNKNNNNNRPLYNNYNFRRVEKERNNLKREQNNLKLEKHLRNTDNLLKYFNSIKK